MTIQADLDRLLADPSDDWRDMRRRAVRWRGAIYVTTTALNHGSRPWPQLVYDLASVLRSNGFERCHFTRSHKGRKIGISTWRRDDLLGYCERTLRRLLTNPSHNRLDLPGRAVLWRGHVHVASRAFNGGHMCSGPLGVRVRDWLRSQGFKPAYLSIGPRVGAKHFRTYRRPCGAS